MSSELLIEENAILKKRIKALEKELDFLKTHPVFSKGIKGEEIVCDATNGKLTKFAESYDVKTEKEIKIEVKYSKLNSPSKNSKTKRWNWSKPNGFKDRGKEYDFLVLIGEKDYRFSDQYPDETPYVYFVIPKSQVASISSSGSAIGANIQIISNIDGVKSEKGRLLKEFIVGFESISDILT